MAASVRIHKGIGLTLERRSQRQFHAMCMSIMDLRMYMHTASNHQYAHHSQADHKVAKRIR